MARMRPLPLFRFSIALFACLTIYIGLSVDQLHREAWVVYDGLENIHVAKLENIKTEYEVEIDNHKLIHEDLPRIVMENNNIAAAMDTNLKSDDTVGNSTEVKFEGDLEVDPKSGLPPKGQRRNVIMIIADDMRPNMGAYKDTMPEEDWIVKTPVMDELAKRSLFFKQAHVQQAVCSPSRASFLTSRRPDTTGVHDLFTYFRKSGGDFTTLPQYFKESGYNTIGVGKIFHEAQVASGHNQDEEKSWTFMDPKFFKWSRLKPDRVAYGNFTREDIQKLGHETSEEQVTSTAEELITSLGDGWKNTGQNFFLAVGYRRPHLPFIVPEEFATMYPSENTSLASNRYTTAYAPQFAWQLFKELRSYPGFKNYTGKWGQPLAEFHQIQLRRHYFAAISWVDSLIGRLMSVLNADEEVRKSTVVAFLGDHGWHLGDHAMWCKFTNFDMATRSPLFIVIPGITDGGIKVSVPIEFVDLFPTLAEVAGLPPIPQCPMDSAKVNLCTEGESLLPRIQNPEDPKHKNIAFSQYPRNGVKGYSLRTPRYRYTEWIAFRKQKSTNRTIHQLFWKSNFGMELYDHKLDDQENVNLASFTAYRHIVLALSDVLRAGWRHAPNYAEAVERLKPAGNIKRIKVIINLSKEHSRKAMKPPPTLLDLGIN